MVFVIKQQNCEVCFPPFDYSNVIEKNKRNAFRTPLKSRADGKNRNTTACTEAPAEEAFDILVSNAIGQEKEQVVFNAKSH